MLRVLVLFLALFAAAAAYVFTERPDELADLIPALQESAPPTTDTTTADPADTPATTDSIAPSSNPEDENETVSAPVVKAAREHIDQITASPEQSINIEKADHFVTIDQLLQIPEPQIQTEAALESVETTVVKADSGQPQTFGVDTGVVTQAITDLPPISASANRSRTSTPIALTELSSDNKIKLQELLDTPDADKSQVYYIHAVNNGDDQGLWGILQTGLTRTFAEGIKLKGRSDRLFAEIPEEADEKLSNNTSSFLGRLLQDKVSTTYIYNYRSGILGDNPDLIEPGQQLIIVQFSETELVRVYNHFINQ